MVFGIDKYLGKWISEDGYHLDNAKTSEDSAIVTLLDPKCKPIDRPYFDNRPTQNMLATYEDYVGEFRVDLWEKNRGFELFLEHEPDYVLDRFRREALVPSISRNEGDSFLDQYCRLFGNLKHYVRSKSVDS